MMELLEGLFNVAIPLLIFVVIWFVLMRYVSGNKSPMLKLMERQTALLEQQIGFLERQIDLTNSQNALLERQAYASERIALALEARNEKRI